jgi:hypothetical protein
MFVNFKISYKIPSDQNAIVVYGKLDPKNQEKFRIYDKGGIFVWPVIQKFYKLYLGDYKLNDEFITVDKNNVNINLSLEAHFLPDLNKLEMITDIHFQKTKEQIESTILRHIKKEFHNESSMHQLNNQDIRSNPEFRAYVKILKSKVNLILKDNGFEEANFCNIALNHNNV